MNRDDVKLVDLITRIYAYKNPVLSVFWHGNYNKKVKHFQGSSIAYQECPGMHKVTILLTIGSGPQSNLWKFSLIQIKFRVFFP